MDGYTFATTTSYDSASRVANTVYPSGLTVQSEYALYGHATKLKNASSGIVYWQLDQSDARGSALQTSLGNGITEYRTYDPATGTVSTIKSFGPTVGAPAIQDLAYVFDKFGNLTQRSDVRQNRSETFVYDNLNRVTSATLESGTTTIDVQTAAYDVRGNIASRSDVGTYTYGTTDGCGAAGPHAVKAIAGTKNAAYCYDANGDMTSGDGRTVTWSAFGMPTTIVKDLRQIAFAYGPERARFKRVDTNETGTTTTYYAAGGTYEAAVTQSGQWTTTAYIAGIATVQTVTDGSSSTTAVRYLLKDHLGSTDVLTDASGAVVTRYAFDAWGKRRDIDWTAFTAGAGFAWQSHPVTRGYTFHEQLDPVDLVHMNGRVYDPTIGRFLSADPFVQDVTNTQALNAYSYVLNNPLSYTDPSGFFFSKIFKAIGNAFRAIGRAFMHAVRAIARSSIGRAILQIAACANPAAVLTCAPVAAGLVLAAGGTLKEALISAALSFAQIGTSFGGAIDIWGSVGDLVQQTGLGLVGKALTHGVVAGSLSMAQGGSFESGFFSGALSAGVGGVAGDLGIKDFGSRTVISVVVGGTTSVLSGGKFANGAVTAAFATMFNDCMHGDCLGASGVRGGEGSQSGMDPVAAARRDAIGDPMYDAAVAAYAIMSPVAGIADCLQTGCSFGDIALAVVGAAPAGKFARGLGNPFKGKSAGEIDAMFRAKGFDLRGPDPLSGKGGYVNPKTGRSYHIDESNRFGERPHVDVNRQRTYSGSLEKKKYDMGP